MGHSEFYDAVAEHGDLDPTAAEAATLAALSVLGDHLSDTVVEDLSATLPDGAAERFEAAAADPPTDFSYEEFVARVADELDVDAGEAGRRARVVGASLAERVDDEALAEARAQLPDEFDRLFWVPDADELLARVEAASDVDSAASDADSVTSTRDAITAVLATLGERLTPGEAAALAAYLPDEFATALEPAEDVPEGATPDASGGERDTDVVAAEYDVDEFVRRVAEREGVDEERARGHVGAVSEALARSVPSREFEDAFEQLPDEYGAIL